MKKLISVTIFAACLLFLSAFRMAPIAPDFIGTYGVSADDPANISLSLHENHTFTYRDFSNPNQKIDVAGTWELHGKAIVLRASHSAPKFHTVWRFSRQGAVATSRKGMTFYSLCKH
jgi:hypothetical protein